MRVDPALYGVGSLAERWRGSYRLSKKWGGEANTRCRGRVAALPTGTDPPAPFATDRHHTPNNMCAQRGGLGGGGRHPAAMVSRPPIQGWKKYVFLKTGPCHT